MLIPSIACKVLPLSEIILFGHHAVLREEIGDDLNDIKEDDNPTQRDTGETKSIHIS